MLRYVILTRPKDFSKVTGPHHMTVASHLRDQFNLMRRKALKLIYQVFYATGHQTFVPTRWTKVTPILRYWGCGLSVHGILKDAFLASDALKAMGPRA